MEKKALMCICCSVCIALSLSLSLTLDAELLARSQYSDTSAKEGNSFRNHIR